MLKFGTSGVRGLVVDMTDRECFLYASAFAQYLLETSDTNTVAVSGDQRSSTPRIIAAIAKALGENGFDVDYCGLIPTPALAGYSFQRGYGSIMVTGSHIPDDRNGIGRRYHRARQHRPARPHDLRPADRMRASDATRAASGGYLRLPRSPGSP